VHNVLVETDVAVDERHRISQAVLLLLQEQFKLPAQPVKRCHLPDCPVFDHLPDFHHAFDVLRA